MITRTGGSWPEDEFRFRARHDKDAGWDKWHAWQPRFVEGEDQIKFPDDPHFEYQVRRANPPKGAGPIRIVEQPRRKGEDRTYVTRETRVTDPKTGGQKGDKPEHVSALDPEALLILATVAGIGAKKYAAHNFLRGYAWSLSFNAMMRHALAFWAGENLDPETGQPHSAQAAWHGLALTSFLIRGIGTDDRPPKKEGR